MQLTVFARQIAAIFEFEMSVTLHGRRSSIAATRSIVNILISTECRSASGKQAHAIEWRSGVQMETN